LLSPSQRLAPFVTVTLLLVGVVGKLCHCLERTKPQHKSRTPQLLTRRGMIVSLETMKDCCCCIPTEFLPFSRSCISRFPLNLLGLVAVTTHPLRAGKSTSSTTVHGVHGTLPWHSLCRDTLYGEYYSTGTVCAST
jgi:hypothetical protein